MSDYCYDRQGNPISLERMGELFDDDEYRFLARDKIKCGGRLYMVVTIWTGWDTTLGGASRPPLFETSVFRRMTAFEIKNRSKGGHAPLKMDPESDVYWSIDDTFMQPEYPTEVDALAGHTMMVGVLKHRSSREDEPS